MLSQSVALGAGQTVKFIDLGNFLRVLSANSAITVRTFRNGQVVTESVGVFSGYAEQFDGDSQFDAVEVYSSTAQTVQIVIRNGQVVYYDQAPSGIVSVSGTVPVDNSTPVNSTGANTQKTVTSSSTSLVAANAARKFLAIQNKDASGKVYINFGAAATFANGILIPAGGYFELNSNMLTAQIFAIGDLASNSNVVVVEG